LADRSPVKHIPDWLDITGFKHLSRKMNDDRQRMYDDTFAFAKQQQTTTEATFVSRFMDEKRTADGTISAEDEEIIKAAAASLYSGGAETVGYL
jgi:hypothetical protein